MTKVHRIDAEGQSMGRVASRVAVLLRGKDSPAYEPRVMPDVQVIVEHIGGIVFKGTKAATTKYYRHSGYPGGLHELTLEKKWARDPKEVFRLAVRGMMPVNRSRDRMLSKLTMHI